MSGVRRVALVTGAGRGLGRAHALALARTMTVVVNDLGGDPHGNERSDAPAQAVADEIRTAGGDSHVNTSDIADWSQATSLVDEIYERFGRLDVIVNNAGISRAGLLGNLEEQDWDRQFEVNVKGAVALVNAAAWRWRQSPPAPRAIVNTSSPAGPHPIAPIGLYSATKAAIAALTISAAQELAVLGVRVNAIAPIANTRLIDHAPDDVRGLMRSAEGLSIFAPENVAELVSYLASPDCQFTGRLFGIRADEIYLFSEWSADLCFSNAGKPWTHTEIAKALGKAKSEAHRWTMTASGRWELSSPSKETLETLLTISKEDIHSTR